MRNNNNATCKERVEEAFKSRMSDVRKLWKSPDHKADLGDGYKVPLNEYGLCIDFVPANTFRDQKEGNTRYQISWGGPSEEFRVFTTVPRVEFWFMDWYDGAHVVLERKDANIIRAVVGKAEI